MGDKLLSTTPAVAVDVLDWAWTTATSGSPIVDSLPDDDKFALVDGIALLVLERTYDLTIAMKKLDNIQRTLVSLPASDGLKRAALAGCEIQRGIMPQIIESREAGNFQRLFAARKAAIGNFRKAADLAKSIDSTEGRFELAARAWVESGMCFYDQNQLPSAVKCFKKAMKFLQSIQHSSSSIRSCTSLAIMRLKAVMPPITLQVYAIDFVHKTFAGLTKESAFGRLAGCVAVAANMLSYVNTDVCGARGLRSEPCPDHGHKHPKIRQSETFEAALEQLLPS
jgi:tetratricopeptide (TPR) repeat protein